MLEPPCAFVRGFKRRIAVCNTVRVHRYRRRRGSWKPCFPSHRFFTQSLSSRPQRSCPLYWHCWRIRPYGCFGAIQRSSRGSSLSLAVTRLTQAGNQELPPPTRHLSQRRDLNLTDGPNQKPQRLLQRSDLNLTFRTSDGPNQKPHRLLPTR